MADPDDHRTEAERRDGAVPREDAGPRPGEHPTVARSGSSRSTAIGFVAVLVGALLMYALIALGVVGSPGG